MGIIIPGRSVESLRSSGNSGKFVFDEGAYNGVFESATLNDLPAKSDGTPFAGYVSTGDEGERLSIQIGSIEPQEGQGDPGNHKWFLDLVLKDGVYDLENVDTEAKNAPYWQLQKSARVIGNLANALGELNVSDDGKTAEIKDGFVEALKSGFYNGQKIGFIIYNTGKFDKDGKPYQDIETFLFA